MKWVLNIKKGTTVCHPRVGKLEGGKAYQITDEEAAMLKNIMNLVVFEEIVPKKEEIV